MGFKKKILIRFVKVGFIKIFLLIGIIFGFFIEKIRWKRIMLFILYVFFNYLLFRNRFMISYFLIDIMFMNLFCLKIIL